MDYAKYIEAFNAGDDAALVQRFFTEDCLFQSGPRVLRGRNALLEFLNWAHDGIREIIRAQLVLRDEHHLFAEIDMDFHDITTQFTAIEDAPDFVVAPLQKGEFVRGRVFVYYTLRDGRISDIRVARAGEMSRPQRT